MSIMRKLGSWSFLSAAAASLLATTAAAQDSKAHKEEISIPVAYAAVMGQPTYLTFQRFKEEEEGGTGDDSKGTPKVERLTDSKILFVTHIANAGQIDDAKLAQKQAQDARVRRLASSILKQHMKADRQEEALLKRRGLDMISTQTGVELEDDARNVHNELRAKTGAEFDRAYLASQADAHRKVLELIDYRLLPNAMNDDVKRLVRDLRPTVQSHYDSVRALQLKLKE